MVWSISLSGIRQRYRGTVRSAVYILRLNTNGTVKTGGITLIGSGVNGGPTLGSFSSFGTGIANLGDIDGDGMVDIAVGAALDSSAGSAFSFLGSVYVLRLNPDGTVKTGGVTQISKGVNGGPSLSDQDNFGRSVTSLGDFDGDGIVDIAVGAYGDDTGAGNAGAVYLLRLNADGTVKPGGATKIAGATNGGPTLPANSRFGASAANMGDVDGDGVTDLAIGARNATAVYVVRLNADGTVKPNGITRIGNSSNGGPALPGGSVFGQSVASLGDFDADGVADLIVGDPGDPGAGSNRGAVYILRLDVPATPTAIGLSANTIAENQPSGTAIGTFSSTDANPFDTFTYTLVTGTGDTDNGSFQIVGNALQSNAVFDFETKSSYTVRVRTTDDSNRFSSRHSRSACPTSATWILATRRTPERERGPATTRRGCPITDRVMTRGRDCASGPHWTSKRTPPRTRGPTVTTRPARCRSTKTESSLR